MNALREQVRSLLVSLSLLYIEKKVKALINECLPNRILSVVFIPSTIPVVTRGVVWG